MRGYLWKLNWVCSAVDKFFWIHSTMYIYWVWSQSRLSKLSFWADTFWESVFFNSQVTKVRNFPQILQPWWISLKNFRGISRESFPVTDSSEILENFPRIGPQDERFLWDHSFETQFQEIPEKFFEIFPLKIPQNFSVKLLRQFLNNS